MRYPRRLGPICLTISSTKALPMPSKVAFVDEHIVGVGVRVVSNHPPCPLGLLQSRGDGYGVVRGYGNDVHPCSDESLR